MYALMLTTLLAAAPAEAATDVESAEVRRPAGVKQIDAKRPALKGRDLAEATRDALQRWAGAEGDQVEPAARELLRLYRDLRADTELAVSQRTPLRRKIAGRLDRLAQLLRNSGNVSSPERASHLLRDNEFDAGEFDAGRPLAQQGFGGRGFGQAGAGGGGFGQAGFGMGGRGFGQAPVGQPQAGFGNDDHGEDLADLIQTTIRPDTWERNGGPGAIYYWRNHRALIIRQRQDVHEEIGGLLDQLQRAGQ